MLRLLQEYQKILLSQQQKHSNCRQDELCVAAVIFFLSPTFCVITRPESHVRRMLHTNTQAEAPCPFIKQILVWQHNLVFPFSSQPLRQRKSTFMHSDKKTGYRDVQLLLNPIRRKHQFDDKPVRRGCQFKDAESRRW